jgi:hypothetical protein
VDGREYFLPGAKEEQERLFDERHCVWKRIGLARIPSGFGFEIRLNGVAYTYFPNMVSAMELLEAFNQALPTPSGPREKRNRIVWLIWHFRARADIQAGPTADKVRSPMGECTSCGYRHGIMTRTQSGCPRCHGASYRQLTRPATLSSFGRITKARLRRRFKMSRYELDILLSYSPPLPVSNPPDPVL